MAKKKKKSSNNRKSKPTFKKSVIKRTSTKRKTKKRKEPDSFKRYRKVLSIVSRYDKEHGIKPGKDIYSQSSEIYRRTREHPLKFINQNIDVLYKDYIQPPEIKTDFPDIFPFYVFSDNLNIPKFDGVKISIFMDDDIEEFSFEGYRSEVDAYYKEHVHSYLRTNYNKSPTATFRISNTDQRTFVNYIIETGRGKLTEFPQEPVLPPEKITKQELKQLPTEKIEKQIELEKETQKTIKEKVKAIEELRKAGLTIEEIKKYLGI